MVVTDNSEALSQMIEGQVSNWDTPSQVSNTQRNIDKSSQPNVRQCPPISTNNAWTNNVDYTQGKKRRKDQRYCPWSHPYSCCIQGVILGCLLAGLALAIVIALWLTSGKTTTSSTIEVTSLSGTCTPSSTTTTSSVTTSTSTTATSTSTTTSSTSTTTTSTSTATPTCATWLWNTTGETVAGVTGSPGSASNQLNSSWNIYVDPTNNILYIADSGNNRIQQWLPGATSGTTIAGTGSPGATAMLLHTPKDVFVDSSQNIYVADSLNQRIQFFPNGSTTGVTLSLSWPSVGQLWGVQVVAGSIYACDNTQSAVWKNGSAVAGDQGTGPGANQLNLPQGFAVDTSVAIGTIYAVNSQQHTIVQWPVGASTGTVVAGVNGSPGSSSTLLKYPVSIKLDSYTNMFVVDNNNHRIQLFCQYPTINTTARTIVGTGVLGSTAQTLNYPAGIALDASLNLYVSDTSNHRVQRFQRLQ